MASTRPLLAVSLVFAFVAVAVASGVPASGQSWAPCEHPYPCADGSEWPPDLHGPFAVAGQDPIEFEMSDGAVLHGVLVWPDVEVSTGLPTVLVMTPYLDSSMSRETGALSEEEAFTHGPVRALVEAGFAVTLVADRGSWHSEGCWDWFTERTRQDRLEVLDDLATRPWSNGRIGMMGMSAPTIGIWEAIGDLAPQLKAAAVAGNIRDPFRWITSPQGLALWAGQAISMPQIVAVTQIGVTTDPIGAQRTLDGHPRPCVNHWITDHTLSAAGDRSTKAQRTTLPDIHDGQAAVLMLQGTQDALAWSDEGLWEDYAGPKSQVVGNWSHEFPTSDHLDDWPGLLIGWFDFWLKGLLPTPPILNHARFEASGETETATRWPPPAAERRALYLSATGLGQDPATFSNVIAAPMTSAGNTFYSNGILSALCESGQPPYASVHRSEPLTDDMVLAGDAWLLLDVEATTGHGGFAAQLFAIPPDFSCTFGRPNGERLLTHGGADLSYLDGASRPTPSAPGTRIQLRVDLNSMATSVGAGEHLVLVLAANNPESEWGGATQAGAIITITGDGDPGTSHLVLPVLRGALPSADALPSYPPRPFSRAWFASGGTVG